MLLGLKELFFVGNSVILITYLEEWAYDSKGRKSHKLTSPKIMVSHGVDPTTSNNVIVPQESLDYYIHIGAKLGLDGEYHLC